MSQHTDRIENILRVFHTEGEKELRTFTKLLFVFSLRDALRASISLFHSISHIRVILANIECCRV